MAKTQVLSFPVRLPDALQADALRLLDASQEAINALVVALWHRLAFSPACSTLSQHSIAEKGTVGKSVGGIATMERAQPAGNHSESLPQRSPSECSGLTVILEHLCVFMIVDHVPRYVACLRGTDIEFLSTWSTLP
jgi:hypothetical protein